jgi:hypothetical protein
LRYGSEGLFAKLFYVLYDAHSGGYGSTRI